MAVRAIVGAAAGGVVCLILVLAGTLCPVGGIVGSKHVRAKQYLACNLVQFAVGKRTCAALIFQIKDKWPGRSTCFQLWDSAKPFFCVLTSMDLGVF